MANTSYGAGVLRNERSLRGRGFRPLTLVDPPAWQERAASHFGQAAKTEGSSTLSSNEHHPNVIVHFQHHDGKRPSALVRHTKGFSLEVRHDGFRPIGSQRFAKPADFSELYDAAARAHESLIRFAPKR